MPRSGRGSIRPPWPPGVSSRASSTAGPCRWSQPSWPCLATASLIGWLFFEIPALPFLIIITVEGILSLVLARRVRTVLADVDRRTHDLVLLSELLSRLESEPFQTPLLRRLAEALQTEGLPASTRIRRLARLLHLLETRRNQFFMPLAALWLWTTQIAMRIDAWRGTVGPEVAHWIEAIGKFEALCALGAYAAENPQDPFAEIVDSTGYEAEALGHPLIPARDCVRNDIELGPVARVLIVSGSNMSGKSTLLRTVGINAVLALAGAPVRARRLRLSLLAVGATLRIQDSLQAGRSRFYAEITRVRQLVDLSRGPLPLLFLFDELFHGTNSHDRCVGAESVVKGLVDRGAIGLLTTHDLALTQIADRLAPLVIERPLRRPARGWQDALRLPDEARRRRAQQCAGPHARDRAGSMNRRCGMTKGRVIMGLER